MSLIFTLLSKTSIVFLAWQKVTEKEVMRGYTWLQNIEQDLD